MNLLTLRKRVANYINYVDSSRDLLTNKDINSDDIDQWLNDRYLEDVFPEYADKRPNYFSREATASNSAGTGTVDATSTGTTLVATTSIFTSDMVDARVYNSTDGEFATITDYTSGTQVTLDTTIGDTWDGDTIYIFTGTFTFGGDATDIHRPMWVGVKYSSTDTDYTRAEISDDEDLFDYQRGPDSKNFVRQSIPTYTFDTVTIASVPTSAIKIFPYDWSEVITDAIFLRYIEKPAEMSADNDVPRLPLGHHKFLVYGATADAFLKLGMFDEANQFETRYLNGKAKLMKQHVAEREKRTLNFGKRTYKFKSRHR